MTYQQTKASSDPRTLAQQGQMLPPGRQQALQVPGGRCQRALVGLEHHWPIAAAIEGFETALRVRETALGAAQPLC